MEQTRLHMMHCSMQFSDDTKKKKADAAKLLDRAATRKAIWLTGTEAGSGQSKDLQAALKAESKEHGFRYHQHPGSDSWVTVNREFIDGGWDPWSSDILVPAVARKNTAKRLIGVDFDAPDGLGRLSSSVCHYMTKGRPDAKSAEYRQFLDDNIAIAKEIGLQAQERGRGRDKFFYSGDQNIVDVTNDTFLGEAKMLSAADELGRYENTGHGAIDVIASYNRDGLVKAAYWRVLDDSEFRLFTDHYLCEAGFDVGLLTAA